MCIVLWEQQVCPKSEQISLQHRPTFSVLSVLHFAVEFCTSGILSGASIFEGHSLDMQQPFQVTRCVEFKQLVRSLSV